MRKVYKNLICLCAILIAGLNYITTAFAQDPFTAIAIGGFTGLSGAGLFGSMAGASGINIGWSQQGSDPMDALWNELNPEHVYFSGKKHEATNIEEDIYDYIQVDIGDWLQAQTDFISEFASNYNVQDDDNGIVTVLKSWRGVEDQTRLDFVGPTSGSTITFPHGISLTTSGGFTRIYLDGVLQSTVNGFTVGGRYYALYNLTGNTPFFQIHGADSGTRFVRFELPTNEVDNSENISWDSGAVDLDKFDDWDSARVKIPSSISQLQSGWTLEDFLNELNRIWTGAGEDNIIIENGSDSPVPPTPVPIPDTQLGQVPFDDWVDLWGQSIYEQLENQNQGIDFIGANGEDQLEELESIDNNLEDLNQTAESIDTNIGIGNGLLGGIRNLVQSAVDYLEGIAEHVGELVEEIVEGTETLISGILNQIPQAFGVIFTPIKQASTIWHYVVEWINSISAPFSFIWSMASGTSYYIVLPVYASLAAAVVLAFYKRFGK